MTDTTVATLVINAVRQFKRKAKCPREENRSDHQRNRQIVVRELQVRCRPEQCRVHLYTLQAGTEEGERGFDFFCDVRRVGPGEFLNHQRQRRRTLDDGVANERLVVFNHGGHIRKAFGRHAVEGDLAQVARLLDGQDVPDSEPLIGRLNPSAGAWRRGFEIAEWRRPQRVAGGLDNLRQRHLLIPQVCRIDLDLQLPLALAPDRDVGHALAGPSDGAQSSSGPAQTCR